MVADEEAFIQAISECPEDEPRWLVYADWLQDHDDPFGELIRVEIQLEKAAKTDPQRPLLEQRKRELENIVSFVEWKGGLSQHGFYVSSRRGFVETLSLEFCKWALLDASQIQTKLQYLHTFLDRPCRFLALMTTFVIYGEPPNYGSENEFPLPPDFAKDLLTLPCFTNLNTLRFGGNGLLLGAETVRVIAGHSNLKRLCKLVLNHHYQFGDEGVRALTTSSRLENLTKLDLSRTEMTNEGARVLSESVHFAKLTELLLYSNRISDEGVRALANSTYLANLTELNLDYNRISDEGARAIAESVYLENLTELDLRENRIGDEGAKALASSSNLGALKKLKLYGNSIGEEGALALKRRFGRVCLIPQLQEPEKLRPGDWLCFECSARNFAVREACYECRSPRSEPYLRPGDWLCPGCKAHNFAKRQTCFQCKATRPS
jgi:uncharacterized protein (TIGR02996 family)